MRGALGVLVATTNRHKLEEIRAIFAPLGLRAVGIGGVEGGAAIVEPREDGATFEENARIKAAHYARATGRLCVADDSGLEVDALGGEPGVHSAYYAHGMEEGMRTARAERDAANNAKLLRALTGVPDERRTARFVCVMIATDPSGRVVATGRGEFAGRIGREPRGVNGFGYDPLLVLEDGRTSAELPPHEKNTRSHRAAAARAIAPALRAALLG